MNPFFISYVTAWGLAFLIALYLMLRNRREIALFDPGYWRFLLHPWKIVTFAVAASGLILVAPYTGDPTWDYWDAAFMSVLTFATGPWAVGILYMWVRGSAGFIHAYIALCLLLFSAGWSYDLYLLIRDGSYPDTWFVNLPVSSLMYVSAGLLWNLEWTGERGVIFSFMRQGWPYTADGQGFFKVIWFALPLMALAAALCVPFIL